jgi:hypothetical protein
VGQTLHLPLGKWQGHVLDQQPQVEVDLLHREEQRAT